MLSCGPILLRLNASPARPSCLRIVATFRLCSNCACNRHTQHLLDFAEVGNRFHLPTIQTQDESAWIVMILSSQSSFEGRLRGRGATC